MKAILLSLLLFISISVFPASPAKVIRVPDAVTAIGEDVPEGTILIDTGNNRVLQILTSALSTQSISDLVEGVDYQDVTGDIDPFNELDSLFSSNQNKWVFNGDTIVIDTTNIAGLQEFVEDWSIGSEALYIGDSASIKTHIRNDADLSITNEINDSAKWDAATRIFSVYDAGGAKGDTIPTEVRQTITDGVTATAPSENAVFDALALKQNTLTNPITGTGASGQVSFWNGTSTQTGDNGLFWDNTTKSLGIGTTNPGEKLDVSGGNIDLDDTTNENQYGVISKNGKVFIHDFNYGNNGTVTTDGGNTFLGINAGNLTMGSTATQSYHGSYNTGVGSYSLYSNTTGRNNTANGSYSLYSNTTGNNNTALGVNSGRYIADGTTGRTTGNNGLYIGSNTKASADETNNEIVIGSNAIGAGSNSVVLGNISVTKTLLNGNVGRGTTTPAYEFDNVGEINTTVAYRLNATELKLDAHKSGSIGLAGTLYVSAGATSTPTWKSLADAGVQDTLSSGINIKTVFGLSLLGSGDIGTAPIAYGGTGLTALGTASQLMRVNSGATALEYFTPDWIDADLIDTTGIVNNDLLKYNSTTDKFEDWTPNFLTSYTETDPVYIASSWYTTANNSSNWNTAYTFTSRFGTIYPDLTAIEAIAGTSGLLKKTAANTWTLDTNTYATEDTLQYYRLFTDHDSLSTLDEKSYNSLDDLPNIPDSISHALVGIRDTLEWGIDSIANYDTRLIAVEGLDTTGIYHTNRSVLDGISATDTTEWAAGYTHIQNDFDLSASNELNDSIKIIDGYLKIYEAGSSTPDSVFHTAFNITNGTGFLKNNGTGTWSYDNSTYLTSITSSDVTTALGFTPYNATNPDGFITSAALSGYATESWVNNNGFVNTIYINGGYQGITYGYLDLIEGGGLDVSYNAGSITLTATGGSGTVTSVDMSVPTGFSVSGNPITTSGTLALAFAAGYSLPTDATQSNWNTAYGWGNHASAGYLTSETDPVFTAHLAYDITAADTTRWGTAGGGSPGGSSGDIQYNNSGSFGGFGDWNGSTLSVPGDVVIGTSAYYLTDATDASTWGIFADNGVIISSSGTSFTFSGSGNLTVPGTITGSEVYRGSSRELKKNIKPMRRSGLDLINNTEICTYNLKSSGQFGVGFIAEDTDWWISGKDQKKHEFGNHLGVITKAIQEEDQKVEKLRELIDELTIKLYDAEKRIKKLERKCKR